MGTDFDTELMEVLASAGEEFNDQMRQMSEVAARFFTGLAQRIAAVGPGETLEDQLPTTLALVFMAGRLHAQRGYTSPLTASEQTGIDDEQVRRLLEGDQG